MTSGWSTVYSAGDWSSKAWSSSVPVATGGKGHSGANRKSTPMSKADIWPASITAAHLPVGRGWPVQLVHGMALRRASWPKAEPACLSTWAHA